MKSVRSMRGLRTRRALGAWVLLMATFHATAGSTGSGAEAPGSPRIDRPAAEIDDWALLLRAGQLSAWQGMEVPLPVAVCVSQGWGLAWPQDLTRLSRQVADTLRRRLESCQSADAPDQDLRVIPEARQAMRQRLEHLRTRLAEVRRCQAAGSASAMLSCLRETTGKPGLSGAEAEQLKALAASSAPTASAAPAAPSASPASSPVHSSAQ